MRTFSQKTNSKLKLLLILYYLPFQKGEGVFPYKNLFYKFYVRHATSILLFYVQRVDHSLITI